MSDGQARPLKKVFSLAAFLAVALASLGMAGFAYVASKEAARFKFEAVVDDAMNRVEGRLDLQLSLLRSTQAFLQARGGEMSSAEFTAYFAALDVPENFKGLHGIGLLGLDKHGNERSLESRIAEVHGNAMPIHPPSTQQWRTPVLLYEPLQSNHLDMIGYDMFTDPARRSAIELAVQSGEPRATGRVLLGKESHGSDLVPGFLIFASIGGISGPQETAADPGAVSGLVYVAFRTGDLFQAAIGTPPLLPVAAEVFDGTPEDKNLFYRSRDEPSAAYGRDFLVVRTILLGGRAWTLRFRPTNGFSEPTSPSIPVMLGVAGLLLAGAMAMIARYQERAYEAASQLHATTEKSLLERELMLQEMKHRIKNSISRVLAIARQTAVHSQNLDEFSASFSDRLQAMAASQDMLTRSRWQKADLRELVEIELRQVFGKELPDEMLSGPPVLLDETMTQALGLTFHELATNALKYGEVGDSMSALTVRWSVSEGSEKRLQLAWAEHCSRPIELPNRVGFGTKLIDMNIERELNGTIQRSYGLTGLEVKIEIPLTDAPESF